MPCAYSSQKVKLKSCECPKWFTPDIRHLSNCCRTLRRKCNPHPTPHNCSKLKLSEEKLQAKMRSGKSDYETNLANPEFCKQDSSKIYKCIRGITRQNSIPPTFNFESSFATSDRDRASLFNAYFHSVLTHSSFALPPPEDFSSPE